jgi:hypothetical protein
VRRLLVSLVAYWAMTMAGSIPSGRTGLVTSAWAAEACSAELIAHVAVDYLEGRQPRRPDCSGLSSEILENAGCEGFSGSVAELLAMADQRGLLVDPAGPLEVGDLLILDYTYIKGDAGTRLAYPGSHTALVIDGDADVGWTALHYSTTRRGPARLRIDPLHPSDRGRNDQVAMPGHPPLDHLLLSGELLGAVARLAVDVEDSTCSADVPEPAHEEPLLPPPSPAGEVVLASAVATRSPARMRRASRRAARARRQLSPASSPTTELRLQVQVIEGQLLDEGQLVGLGCQELWVLRNSIFAVKGFAFRTDRAQHHFGQQAWYERDPAVHIGNAWELLGEVDRRNVQLIQAAEQAGGCD